MAEKIIIGADLVPTKSNESLFISGNADELVGNQLLSLIRGAKMSIFNLEVPLVDAISPIGKCGPNLIASTKTVVGYKAIGVDLLTISNNHILDQGKNGFFSTLNALNDVGINYVGGGENLQEAIKPYIFEFAGKKVGVYACCEHEFSIATDNSCGANPFDFLESFSHVSRLSDKCDYIIVLYHGGKEHYRYPSPQLQRVCRKFADYGANLVVCQHSHCIGCKEEYKNSTIVYGQGNFLFDRSESEFWKTSILIEIDSSFNLSFIPIVKDKEKVRLADNECENEILQGFLKRSQEINEDGFIGKKYSLFSQELLDGYLIEIGARRNLIGRIINRLTHGKYYKFKVRLLYRNRDYLAGLNFLECEAHQEVIISGLRNRLGL